MSSTNVGPSVLMHPAIRLLLLGPCAFLLAGLIWYGLGLGRLIDRLRRAATFDPAPGRAEANLEARIRSLEARLARLEAERSVPTRADSAGQSTGADRRADSGRPWGPARRPSRREDEPVLIALPDLATTGARNSAEAFAEFDRRFGVLWGLADEGLSDDEIAARTGYPAGQVELILGLRRPSGPAAAGTAPEPSPVFDPEHPPRGAAPDA